MDLQRIEIAAGDTRRLNALHDKHELRPPLTSGQLLRYVLAIAGFDRVQ